MIPCLKFSACLLCATLSAFSPRFHEIQTQMALGLIPKDMQAYIKPFETELLRGTKGLSLDVTPTAEEVAKQFQLILQMSEEKKKTAQIVQELGNLARMVQLLIDPSIEIIPLAGSSRFQSTDTPRGNAVRTLFQTYGDDMIPKMVLTKEPYWAITSALTPQPYLLRWQNEKTERYKRLLDFVNVETGKAKGSWDTLSIPFAQLQLSFSNGIHATANLWILAYRAAGELWDIPEPPKGAEPETVKPLVISSLRSYL